MALPSGKPATVLQSDSRTPCNTRRRASAARCPGILCYRTVLGRHWFLFKITEGYDVAAGLDRI